MDNETSPLFIELYIMKRGVTFVTFLELFNSGLVCCGWVDSWRVLFPTFRTILLLSTQLGVQSKIQRDGQSTVLLWVVVWLDLSAKTTLHLLVLVDAMVSWLFLCSCGNVANRFNDLISFLLTFSYPLPPTTEDPSFSVPLPLSVSHSFIPWLTSHGNTNWPVHWLVVWWGNGAVELVSWPQTRHTFNDWPTYKYKWSTSRVLIDLCSTNFHHETEQHVLYWLRSWHLTLVSTQSISTAFNERDLAGWNIFSTFFVQQLQTQ